MFVCRLERLTKGKLKSAEEKAAAALETEALNRIQAALEASQPARSVPLRQAFASANLSGFYEREDLT